MSFKVPKDVKEFEDNLKALGYDNKFLIKQLPANVRPDRSLLQRAKDAGIIRHVGSKNGCKYWKLRNS